MSCYLDLVKGNDAKMFTLDILEDLSRKLQMKSACYWPTFLNMAVIKGKASWEKHITGDNYRMTVLMYTNLAYLHYTDWLIAQSFSSEVNILLDLAKLSKSSYFMKRYSKYVGCSTGTIINKAIFFDNVSFFKDILDEGTFKEEDIFRYLRLALNNNSSECVKVILEFMQYMKPTSLGVSIWSCFASFGDCSAIDEATLFLHMTPTNDLAQVLLGPFEECELNVSEIGLDTWMRAMVTRIPNDCRYALRLLHYCRNVHSSRNFDFVSKLVGIVLSSARSSELTEKIITSLDEVGFSFRERDCIDLCRISVQSWKAVLNKSDIFLFNNTRAKNSVLDRKLLLPSNQGILDRVADRVFPSLRSHVFTQYLIRTGSKISQRLWSKGHRNTIDPSRETLIDCAQKGNLFVMALVIQRQRMYNLMFPRSILDGVCVHQECIPLVQFCYTCPKENLNKLIETEFGSLIFDTSRVNDSILDTWLMYTRSYCNSVL